MKQAIVIYKCTSFYFHSFLSCFSVFYFMEDSLSSVLFVISLSINFSGSLRNLKIHPRKVVQKFVRTGEGIWKN